MNTMPAAKTPEAKPSIYELLPLVQREIGSIGKDKVNSHQRYNFRGIDDVLNAIGPALAKVGVTVTAQVVKHHREEVPHKNGFRVNVLVKLRVTFWGPDGSSLVNCTVGEAQDFNGDKATNKAMSVAFKYAAFMGLAIPIEPGVMDDSDHDAKPSGGQPATTQPMSDPSPPQHEMSPQQKAAITRKRNAEAKKAAEGKPADTPVGKPQKHSEKGGEKPARKEPPNSMDGKPISSGQLAEIRNMVKVITGQPIDGEDSIAKAKGLLGHFNDRRKTEDKAPAAKVQELEYWEAEQAIKILKRQLPK